MRYLLFVVAVALALAGSACRGSGDDGAANNDAAGSDAAPDGTGCTDTTPRANPVTAFVGPQGLQTRLTTAIDSAQHTLDLQMYLFTVQAIADRVVAAKQRGVTVRVILDPDEAGNDAVHGKFDSAGVAWRDATRLYTYAHAKYFIVDGKTSYIMSMNFNADAMDASGGERNYGVVDTDPEDLADLAAIFRMDWASAGMEAVTPADLGCTRLVVSPNNSKQRVLDLVNGAQSTLELELLYLSESTTRAAVVQAKQRGVAVRVILATPDTTPDDTTTLLKNQGIPVEWADPSNGAGFYLHAKLIMADDKAFVGSENMSQTSLTMNREVGVVVTEPDAFSLIHTQFESDWTASVTQ
jgi:phosphatidylserine/phosphatidylglycerophosphate/cardiolipin synthase-like enzyme